ncbi:DUF2141 domain-containing protein [Sphingomonas sabuli]|uniref:DUF2141 domain-containing protein n=1 Tax=Sphingomonas sabuli TaxID=2764186 RepID=A0A7G9KZT6_9SPHN|nr:DUF2141 domain-containing protein [Sphingomonas sabuli]QNM81885.1 DUF2141 domain-containing protein [Sphingomonas sabuli]
MLAIFLLAAAQAATVQSAPATATIELAGLRNTKGWVRVCMTREPSHFPKCSSDPAALSQTVPATAPTAVFAKVPPGDYAVSVFHDENGNRKLDTMVAIPREGFGFSRNPKLRFGPPRFKAVVVHIGPGSDHVPIRMQYLL